VADFPGVNYRGGLIGDGFAELDNTSHVDRDVLRRRPGYDRKAAVAGRYASPYSGQIALHAADNTLRLVDASTYAISASKATLGATEGTFVRYNGRLYWSSGAAGPFVLDDTSSAARTPGIPAPSGAIGNGTVSAGAGAIVAGAHLFRYRYKNAATGYLSNPSGAITKTLVTNDRLMFTIGTSGTDIIRDAGGWADRIVVEATLANGSAFYAAYDVAMADSTLNFDHNDINISARTPALVYGDDGHNPMPQFDILVEHRSRLFGIKTSSKLLGWSRPGYPESWDITVYARKLANMETGDTVVGAVSFLGDLYLFNPYGMSRFTYADSPDAGTVLGIPTDQGLWNRKCIVAVNNVLYGFGPGGIWMIRAMNPEHISTEVDAFIEDLLDTAQSGDFHGWYNQVDRSITWMFAATGDTEPKRGVTYAVQTGKWSTRTYAHEVIGSVYAYQKNYLAANGYLWQERAGYLDGVSGVVTATATMASTTTVATTEAMVDYTGGHLTFGAQTRLITGYGANSLTIASAFSPAMAAGDVAFVGAAPITVETDWLADPDLVEVKDPTTLLVEFEPAQSDRMFTVSVYRDFSASPVTWTRDTADTPPSGVEYLNNATTLSIAADGGAGKGFVPMPLQAEWSRCLKIRFVASDPTTPFGLISLRLAGRKALERADGSGE